MNVISLFALIGLLLVFGISEIIFCKFLLGILSNPLVVLIMSTINFLVVLFIIRLQPQRKPLEESSGEGTFQIQGQVLEGQYGQE